MWLPYLLEILEYIVQYQYATNTHLVYGMMTRMPLFSELQTVAMEPAARLALAASPSATTPAAAALTPGATPNGSVSPRSECSAVSADPLSESQVASWQRDMKLHL